MRTLPPAIWRLLPVLLAAALLALPASAGAATHGKANASPERGIACLTAHGVEPGLHSTSDPTVKAAVQACSAVLPSAPAASKLPPPQTIDSATLPAPMQETIACLKAHGVNPATGPFSIDNTTAKAALEACSASLPTSPPSDAGVGLTNGG